MRFSGRGGAASKIKTSGVAGRFIFSFFVEAYVCLALYIRSHPPTHTRAHKLTQPSRCAFNASPMLLTSTTIALDIPFEKFIQFAIRFRRKCVCIVLCTLCASKCEATHSHVSMVKRYFGVNPCSTYSVSANFYEKKI